jgi:ABC-type sugar transport system ATPase subunit
MLTDERVSEVETRVDAPVLRLEHLSKTFPGTRALSDVSLEVRAHEVHALVGSNGSGKSTLIKTLAGYHAADPGAEGWLNGEPFSLDTISPARHHSLRFVHQDLGIIPQLSVIDNLSLSRGYAQRRSGRIDWTAQRRRARALLERFRVGIDVDRPLSEATPVQRVIVAIASALQDWEDGRCLLVLDEPTAVLPATEVGFLFETIRDVQSRGASVLYVSHRMDEIFTLASRVTVLRGGRSVATEDIGGVTSRALAGLMVGEDVETEFAPPAPTHGAEPVLTASSLHGRYLRGVDLTLHRGEVLGIAGLPGSGREELAELVSGVAPPAEVTGALVYAKGPGIEVRVDASHARELELPMVPPDRGNDAIFAEWSVRENLSVRVLDRVARQGVLRRGGEAEFAEHWIGRLTVQTAGRDAGITTLSGGNQQKVVLARCLATEAPVLVLCEPTAGVDINARIAIYELIVDEAQKGLGVLVSSSDEGDLTALCSRVVVLRDGVVAAELVGDAITDHAVLHAMQGDAHAN